MTYTPTTWVDEIPGETPVKFTITDDVEGEIAGSATIELTNPALTGTAINAARLNAIEQGIADVEAATVPAILVAKGDLVVASAAQTAALLGVGDAGDYLIPDSTETPGLLWSPMIVHDVWTSTDWDDPRWPEAGWSSARIKDTTYLITPETDFGTPANIKAVLVNVRYWIYPSGDFYIAPPAAVAPETAFIYGPNPYVFDNPGMSLDDSAYITGWVPLDDNGQFALRTGGARWYAFTLTILACLQ